MCVVLQRNFVRVASGFRVMCFGNSRVSLTLSALNRIGVSRLPGFGFKPTLPTLNVDFSE